MRLPNSDDFNSQILEEIFLQQKAHQFNPEKQRWLEVLGISMPLCLSYLPIGVACGILLHAAGMNFVLTFLISIMVFSGGAQFILASLLVIDAPISTIFMTLFFLELRYALLGSSLSKYFRTSSQKFVLLFSASMNDENYAVNYLKFATDKKWTPKDALLVEHYSLISWASGNLIGGLIGSTVTIDLEIVDFALTALFIYMIIMQMRSNLSLIICITSAILALVFLTLTKSTLGIIIATLIASLVGFMIEDQVRKHAKDPKNAWVLRRFIRPAITRHTVEDRKMLDERAQAKATKTMDNGEE
ncbi:AzlC family ABC transporter permease [Lactobacillus alvi]|uniref:AzlC family ABC transporter permease n=2 Tax=Lactobacillales TaxID=186826 RepID=A0ABS2ERK6_9LACO|nr:AzlC family ABC transporter permease [Limosilactobacillus alvi]QLL69225.1 branched-chain amino acid ABC transporter permease [Lactobacillus sp. 3B(2020)]